MAEKDLKIWDEGDALLASDLNKLRNLAVRADKLTVDSYSGLEMVTNSSGKTIRMKGGSHLWAKTNSSISPMSQTGSTLSTGMATLYASDSSGALTTTGRSVKVFWNMDKTIASGSWVRLDSDFVVINTACVNLS